MAIQWQRKFIDELEAAQREGFTAGAEAMRTRAIHQVCVYCRQGNKLFGEQKKSHLIGRGGNARPVTCNAISIRALPLPEPDDA